MNDTLTINYDIFRRPVTFVLLLIVVIPAIVCAIFIFIFIYFHWYSVIVKTLHHHATFLLLIVSCLYTSFDLPFSMNYLRVGHHSYRSMSFCLWWYWFDYSLLTINLFVTATASIQRHILVYNSFWLNVPKTRWIIHYIPLIISVTYPLIFYTIFMFAYQCSVYFNYSDGWCAYPCYIDESILYNIDWMCNTITPVFIIVVANVALIIRTFRSMQKIRRQHNHNWQRQKKLTLHLLTFSSVYLIVYLPTTTIAILRKLAFPNLYNERSKLYYMYHMIYFIAPLQICLCIFTLPDLINLIKRRISQLFTGSLDSPAVTIQPMSPVCEPRCNSQFDNI